VDPVEYRVALAMGASVGVVAGTLGAAGELVADPLWSTLRNLCPLPYDSMTVRALVMPGSRRFGAPVLEEMARDLHARYVAGNTKALPDKLKPWDRLSPGYKKANVEQAGYAVEALQAAGFCVRNAARPAIFDARKFTPKQVDLMARLEHGRWNVERLQNGWRFGPRDDARQLHSRLVPWDKLSDGPNGVRRYDREAVRAFPEILAKAKLEVYRPPRKTK
jgi:hypothetical protein